MSGRDALEMFLCSASLDVISVIRNVCLPMTTQQGSDKVPGRRMKGGKSRGSYGSRK